MHKRLSYNCSSDSWYTFHRHLYICRDTYWHVRLLFAHFYFSFYSFCGQRTWVTGWRRGYRSVILKAPVNKNVGNCLIITQYELIEAYFRSSSTCWLVIILDYHCKFITTVSTHSLTDFSVSDRWWFLWRWLYFMSGSSYYTCWLDLYHYPFFVREMTVVYVWLYRAREETIKSSSCTWKCKQTYDCAVYNTFISQEADTGVTQSNQHGTVISLN